MCFSAEASFTVGSVLVITGILCLKKIDNSRFAWIALMPVLFGIQQLAEGFVWLYLKGVLQNESIGHIAQILFVVFAWALWPIYSSLALFVAEERRFNKILSVFCFFLGLGIVYVDVAFLLREPVTATVMGNSIYYPASPMYGNFIYGTATLAPIFLSQIKNMWMFSVCLLISFIAAQVIWAYTFTSVWCFFVAVCSLVLLRVLPGKNKAHF